mmetsp:Transcript_35766/g.75316  ORF Transcript_35766/g.75316 Transcript_35766/m.75316 type:complete len:351 (+) Transcript_35766:91-1143(+)
MKRIISLRSSQLFCIPLLLLSWIQCIDGFTQIGGGSVSTSSTRRASTRRPSSLGDRLDQRSNNFSNVRLEEEILRDDQSDVITPTTNNDRRSFLSQLASTSLLATAAGSSSSLLLYPTQTANAIPFLGGPNRRQLELCLVAILRTQYWAMNTAKSIKTKLISPPEATNTTEVLSENTKKQPYLEARLGAKALLTQKIGGGANSRVRELGTFQFKECLDDARYWCGELAKNNQLPSQQTGELTVKGGKRLCSTDLVDIGEELVESLASLVEFDGLETTIDPSPRSSLMLSMYNPQKGTFVYRTLVERVVPSCKRYLRVFGTERMRVVEEFVRRDHGDEIPFEVLEQLYGGA